MKTLKKLKLGYDKFEEGVVIGFLCITTLLIFYQVVMRYVFNNSPAWSEEIARFMFVWESWLGVSLTQKYGKHIKIEMLTGKLHGRKLACVNIAGDVVTIIICIILVKYGFEITNVIFNMNQTSSGAHIPLGLVYLACPLSCGLMGLRLLGDIKTQLNNLKHKPEEEAV
ncbi:TRAP transporter small permease [Anaerovorax odorimutans]|uniref:TRAP transporter small permease n=1 Tax=Anaerovorax odorimutans TaxID=109327 RepID=A0ABT1RP46_9FIRM|nr:TRAP transporter small permease [Anaerovorax odorimutans]MCQ4636967.1 TRAP transporter small permease [Anaerovorax odorimutans]